MAAVNVMTWGLSWDPGADKTYKEFELWQDTQTSIAAGAIKAIVLRERPDIIAIYGEYLLSRLTTSLIVSSRILLARR